MYVQMFQHIVGTRMITGRGCCAAEEPVSLSLKGSCLVAGTLSIASALTPLHVPLQKHQSISWKGSKSEVTHRHLTPCNGYYQGTWFGSLEHAVPSNHHTSLAMGLQNKDALFRPQSCMLNLASLTCDSLNPSKSA
eukprot:1159521-Pelagomonas_calceolata.AAC.11